MGHGPSRAAPERAPVSLEVMQLPLVSDAELLGVSRTWWTAGAVAVLTGVAAYATRRVLTRLIDKGEDGRVLGRQIGRLASIVVVVVGLVWALDIVGVAIGPLVGALGLGGVAVAFAAQDVIQNFIAGVIIQIRRPFRVGDQVTTMEYDGTVRDVDLRAVRLTTFDGLDVVLPAREVLGGAIVNHTRTPLRRTTLELGVRYDTDLELARRVVLEALEGVDGVEAEPVPAAWVREFGDSSINLDTMFWHRSDIATQYRVRSEAAIAIKSGLDRAGIEIPFPQRVLHWGDGAPDPAP
jgi:small conductance mechanosensitive channel